jgi:signal transduction histidine kinase
MKKIACFIFISFTALAVVAQNKKIDSLKLLLQHERTDTAKINKLMQIGNVYRGLRKDSALIYYQDALRLSEKIRFINGELLARFYIANFFSFVKSDYATALDYYLQNLKIEEQTGDTARIFWDTRDVTFIYSHIEDFEKEFEYLNKLKHLISSDITKDSAKLAFYNAYMDTRFASFYEELNKPDSAIYYSYRVYNYGSLKPDLTLIGLGSLRLGHSYRKQKNRDSAVYYYRVCILTALKLLRKDLYRECMFGLGMVYWEDKQTDSAFYYGQNAFNLSQEEKDPNLMMGAAALLAKIYYARKQPDSAYNYLNQSVLLKDSLNGGEMTTRIRKLSIKESLQKQEEEQTKKEAAQEYQSRIRIYSLVGGLSVLIIIIFILYRNNHQRNIANRKIEKAYKDLKSTQAQLIQSEKMASLGELTAGIAHEIQNPLNFVNNFSEVNSELITEMKHEIDKGNLDDAKAIANDIDENEQKIIFHGKRADVIVKGMLQHSRSSSGVKEPTDINALTDEYLRLSYHGLRARDKTFNATLQTDFDTSIGKINIVPQEIGRVILNLITNAFYAVTEKKNMPPFPEGGKETTSNNYEPVVTVSTKRLSPPLADRGIIEIRVGDNGNGIPQKVLDKIFQPFFTTKPTGQGTGLGLSLSYDIVKAHGGEIQVETKEGEGTSFKILLPQKDTL